MSEGMNIVIGRPRMNILMEFPSERVRQKKNLLMKTGSFFAFGFKK